MLCQVPSVPVILDLCSVLLNDFCTLLSGSFIGEILAHCFYGFFNFSLASKQVLCPVLAGEGWRPGGGRNQGLLLELGWNLFLSPNEVLGFSL